MTRSCAGNVLMVRKFARAQVAFWSSVFSPLSARDLPNWISPSSCSMRVICCRSGKTCVAAQLAVPGPEPKSRRLVIGWSGINRWISVKTEWVAAKVAGNRVVI